MIERDAASRLRRGETARARIVAGPGVSTGRRARRRPERRHVARGPHCSDVAARGRRLDRRRPALTAHGVPRATGDLDVWIRPDPENARRVREALLDFGAPAEALGLSPADLIPDRTKASGSGRRSRSITSTGRPVAPSSAFMTSSTACEQPLTATSTSDDSRQRAGDRSEPTTYALSTPSGSRSSSRARRTRSSTPACSAASRRRRARNLLLYRSRALM